MSPAGSGIIGLQSSKTAGERFSFGQSSHVEKHSLGSVFLEAAPEANPELAPLTPFLIHIAKQNGFTETTLQNAAERAKFVYWFFESHHRTRAPYRWPVPRGLLQWLNAPSIECARGLYLTRFMSHAWSERGREFDIRTRDGLLRFLTWFAFGHIPGWNLPQELLPPHLIALLNQPFRDAQLPLTLGMFLRAGMTQAKRFRYAEYPDDAVLIAMSFDVVSETLKAGDPRLVPPFVSEFWFGRPEPLTGLTRYEYVTARAYRPETSPSTAWDPRHAPAMREWFQTWYTSLNPAADVFSGRAGPLHSGGPRVTELRAPSKAIFVYRDHHTVSGLSRAGMATLDALRRSPVPVVDLDFVFGRDRMQEEFEHNQRQLCHAESAVHILNVNPEYVPECLMSHLSKISETDYVIGQFYWELSDIGVHHECGLSVVDELWVASEYLKEVYAKRTAAPIFVMGQALRLTPAGGNLSRARFDLPEDSYLFLVSFDAGSVIERKNPLGAVKAFVGAFPSGSEAAGLVIKTTNMSRLQTERDRAHWNAALGLAERDRRIRILDQTMSDEEMAALYEMCDCYLSLHRSEGFGFGPAEAMARAKPVIATAYSGVNDFCTPVTAFQVEFDLVPVEHGYYPYMDPERTYYWADPDLRSARAQMRRLYDAPQEGLRTGQRAKEWISTRYSMDALWGRYQARLNELGVL